jgi:carbamoyl-phosphate synthase large subunit
MLGCFGVVGLHKILVTGAGGIGGVNFVRALRSMNKFYIVGTDHSPYHIKFNKLDNEYISPRHDSEEFIPLIKDIIKHDKIEFIHPQPEVEAEVIANHKNELETRTYLPSPKVFEICRDKYDTAKMLKPSRLSPKTKLYTESEKAFEDLGKPVWIRARTGAGGRLSVPCESPEEAKAWVNFWVGKKKASVEDFIMQEYLPGRDYAWDSLWYKGELVTSYSRMRLEYIFPHLSPSGITGTPDVSKIVHNKMINEASVKAVKIVDPKPHGFYCLDLKEGMDQKLYVTEINVKAHTTLALWSYIATKYLKLPEWSNISYLYVKIGLGSEEFKDIRKYDIYPEDTLLLRHIDVGVKIILSNGKIQKIQI